MKKLMKSVMVAGLGLALGIGAAHTAHAFKVKKVHKVAICHGTASAKNPYVLINVDANAINGHFDGTAPGHGKNNYPDFLAVNGSCDKGHTPEPPAS